ncbi:hypothetical protein, partial [Leucobacter chironomi]|uniref:hypothetical protein n=1 Tax=Leucobacter chironomi TaxID=491918 RepID=UPI0013755954
PQPQQLFLADVLNAGHQRNAFLVPRRSSKSTTFNAVAVGRAAHREDYRVGILTLTSGKAGRKRFLKDVAAPVEALYRDKRTRPLKVSRIAGMEGLDFTASGGGTVDWLSTLDDVRGEAFDLFILDESGEPNDPEYIGEVRAAVLPTLDTRPGAQVVSIGTAGRFRTGNMLWDAITTLRNGQGGGALWHFPEDVTEEEASDWEPTEDNPAGRARELIELHHPGVGTLTTLDSIKENFDEFSREKFLREYGNIFGKIGEAAGLLDPIKWAEAGTGADLPDPPEEFGLAVAVHPDQTFAAIVAAWREENGRAVLLLIDHKRGVEWLKKSGPHYARKYTRALTFDTASPVIARFLPGWQKLRPRPKLDGRGFMDVKKAATLIVSEVNGPDEAEKITKTPARASDRIMHYRQPELDDAAKKVVKRKAGVSAWALGRDPKHPEHDITAIEAAALALLAFDESKPKTKTHRGRVNHD